MGSYFPDQGSNPGLLMGEHLEFGLVCRRDPQRPHQGLVGSSRDAHVLTTGTRNTTLFGTRVFTDVRS